MGSLYRSQHEFVYVFKARTSAHINNIQLGRYGRARSNVWSYAGATSFGAMPISPCIRRALLSEGNWIGTIYHGLPTDLFRPFEVGSYLAFLGRLTTQKGPEAYRRRSARLVTERIHHVMRM